MVCRVFFSFKYEDILRVNQIKNVANFISTSAVGFNDTSLWQKAIKNGDNEIRRLINKGLENTSVTVVCVTYGTNLREHINYDIEMSLERGNGLVVVQIHHLEDQNFHTASPGIIPAQIKANGFKSYKYNDEEALKRWINEAASIAMRQKKYCEESILNNCFV